MKRLTLPENIVVGFKRKPDRRTEKITEQDRKHVRIMAILEIANNGLIEKMINEDFVEDFEFDKEKQVVYYKVRFIKERESVKYADS